MGILTVTCCERAALFEYFSAPGSQAGCSFCESPVLYFFPAPEPVSCGGAVSNDDPRLPASRMETGLPRAPGPHRQPLNNLRAAPALFAFKSASPHLALVWLSPTPHLPYLPPLNLFPPLIFSPLYTSLFLIFFSATSCLLVLLPRVCPSTPLLLFASRLPSSSLCPTVQVRRGSVRRFLCTPQVRSQTTPREGISAGGCQ